MAENAKIDDGKALFLPDYQRMERALEKQLADPKLDFGRREALQHRLISLKINWQRNGIGNIGVVVALRDGILATLKEAGTMRLSETDMQAIFGDQRAKLSQLNAIITEGKQKGLV